MQYDVTVIGGGIAGAGVAQAAAAAGYKVLLLEQGEIGQQTSSRSSKLIHGGLRYLESAQLNLVYTSLKERRMLLKLAPNLVSPIPFYIPVYKKSRRGKWTLRAGLSLYALLSLFEPLGRFHELPKNQWSKIKGLKTNELEAVFQYWDARTDDEKLTRAVVASAQSLGATAITQASFINSQKIDSGYKINYQVNKPVNGQQGLKEFCIETSMIVNAAGPWVNEVLVKINPQIARCDVELVQGTHIVLDKPAATKVYYLESIVDERVVFVMPWQGKTLVGTTETLLGCLPDNITPQQSEIDYLLALYQHYFPDDTPKLINAFAGVRVLPKQNKQAFSRPRESIIWQSANNQDVISLYGGKLTTFRDTSKQVLAKIEKRLGKKDFSVDIDTLPIG